MHIKHTKIWKFFSSIKLAIWLLAVIAVFSLVGTLIPQNQDPALYTAKFGQTGYRMLLETGLTDVYSSFKFTLLLFFFALNLAVCLVNRFSLKVTMLGSVISHASILVIFAGAVIGMFYGQKGSIEIAKGGVADSFLSKNKERVHLGFSIRLDDFIYREHIDPKEKLVVCSVQPGAPEGQDACPEHGGAKAIAELSTEPGVEHAVADTGYKVKVLRYLPDFSIDTATKIAMTRSATPNNPAIQIALEDKSGQTETFWVFARFPDVHGKSDSNFKFIYRWVGRRPSDFISKVTVLKDASEIMKKDIRVNEPLSFGGYTFFQSSYDVENLGWSGLQVVKDPGVPVVYAGFTLLILGLVGIFYVNPLLKRR